MIAIGIREPADKYQQTQLFRALLEAAPDGMVIVDREGEIVLVNAQVEELFGYERSELIGQQVEILVPDRFSGMHMAFRSGYVGEPRTAPDGPGAASSSPAARTARSSRSRSPCRRWRPRTACSISAAVRDISERTRMQQETDRIKDEFFATVSHELRTPLTSMIGYGELMSDLEELSPQGRRFLSVILRSAERELRLVDDLLTLVAIEESGLAIRSAEIDLERRGARRGRGRPAPLRGGAAPPGAGDPRDRRTDVRRPRPARPGPRQRALQRDQVHPAAAARSGWPSTCTASSAEIDVIDTGVGIGDENPEPLFERLFRAPNAVAQQMQGAGLGLTIALAIVEAHAGTIEVVRSGRERHHLPDDLPAAARRAS